MTKKQQTKNILLTHKRKYPLMQIEDLFKLLHQSSFGCEHMVEDEQGALEYIIKENSARACAPDTKTEALDGDFCRVHLSYLDSGLSAQTLARIFYLSASHVQNGLEQLKEKLSVARELVACGELDFSLDDFDRLLNEWRSCGFCARHHSDAFRQAYSPSYRVVHKKYAKFIPLFACIDRAMTRENIILAIEGGSAAGKSTLADILRDVYDCAVFHMDDFFLRSEQRTPERYAEIGGNIDRERFLSEVLLPLREGKTVEYRRFDCCEMKITASEKITPKRLNVVEGAYSMHPELEKYYDLSVFLDVDEDTQRARIEKRNSPDLAKRFFSEWIPMERKYFLATSIKDRCDLHIKA